jgi:hypothetical protein
MVIDAKSPAVGVSSQSSPAKRNILLQEKQLKLQGETEKNIYKQLKT